MSIVIVDVRTKKEFEEGSYPGAINLPSEEYSSDQFSRYQDYHIGLVCFSGGRAGQVQRKLHAQGFENVSLMQHQVVHIQEGASLQSSVWTVDRQFRLALAILLGVALFGNYVLNTPLSLGLLVFVFAGLVFSAVTDNCYLKEFITMLPWNRTKQKGTMESALVSA
ncbi:MAG: rhodanese-like domain-containing protein [Ekhidna sp.]|nr:rhodanese-like domain-containing protein [Ekhidna sp.]